MRLPSPSEKERMLVDFRARFIPIVNKTKTDWEELTKEEKKQVDKLCKMYYDRLLFWIFKHFNKKVEYVCWK